MKMADFKALTQAEQLTLLNDHLTAIKGMSGRLEDNFKSGEFDFSYSLLKKNAKDLGIVVDGKNYVAYANGEVLPEPETVESENLVKQKQSENKELALTEHEILFLKELYKSHQNQFTDKKQPLFLPQYVGAKKTTGISVYVELWERWGAFKESYPMYSGTDLLARAIEEFMDKYGEEE